MKCLPSFERCKSRLSCLLLTKYIIKGTLSLKGRQTAKKILGINGRYRRYPKTNFILTVHSLNWHLSVFRIEQGAPNDFIIQQLFFWNTRGAGYRRTKRSSQFSFGAKMRSLAANQALVYYQTICFCSGHFRRLLLSNQYRQIHG